MRHRRPPDRAAAAHPRDPHHRRRARLRRGHPDGPSAWTPNVAAAGWVEVDPSSRRARATRSHRCRPGRSAMHDLARRSDAASRSRRTSCTAPLPPSRANAAVGDLPSALDPIVARRARPAAAARRSGPTEGGHDESASGSGFADACHTDRRPRGRHPVRPRRLARPDANGRRLPRRDRGPGSAASATAGARSPPRSASSWPLGCRPTRRSAPTRRSRRGRDLGPAPRRALAPFPDAPWSSSAPAAPTRSTPPRSSSAATGTSSGKPREAGHRLARVRLPRDARLGHVARRHRAR